MQICVITAYFWAESCMVVMNMFKLNRNVEKVILFTITGLIGITLVYRFVVFKTDNVKVVKAQPLNEESREKSDSTKVYVCITGEVKNPGVYPLINGDRLEAAIAAAGGFTENADISSVNLAQKVKDEMYLNIAAKDSTIEGGKSSKSAISGGKININKATADELDSFLPGIGPTLANNIVNYRNKNGMFKSIDEITRVDRIGSGKTFEKIKDLITVN